jgi:hypothetical protein
MPSEEEKREEVAVSTYPETSQYVLTRRTVQGSTFSEDHLGVSSIRSVLDHGKHQEAPGLLQAS